MPIPYVTSNIASRVSILCVTTNKIILARFFVDISFPQLSKLLQGFVDEGSLSSYYAFVLKLLKGIVKVLKKVKNGKNVKKS